MIRLKLKTIYGFPKNCRIKNYRKIISNTRAQFYIIGDGFTQVSAKVLGEIELYFICHGHLIFFQHEISSTVKKIKYGLESKTNLSTFNLLFFFVKRSVLLMLFRRVCNQLGPTFATMTSTVLSGFLQNLSSNSTFPRFFSQVEKLLFLCL